MDHEHTRPKSWHPLLQALYGADNAFLNASEAYRDYAGDHPSDEGWALWSARGEAAVTTIRAYHELATAITEMEAEKDSAIHELKNLQARVRRERIT